MTTYAEDHAAMADAQQQLVNAIKRARDARIAAGVAKTIIDGLTTQYSAFVTSIDARAAAEPGNAAAQALKARKDQLVLDFQEQQNGANNASVAALAARVTGYGPE